MFEEASLAPWEEASVPVLLLGIGRDHGDHQVHGR